MKYKISEDLNSLKLEKYDGKEYLFEPNTFSVLEGLSSDSHEIRERTLLYIKNWRPKIHDEILESYLKSNLEQKKKIENSLKNFLLHNHKRKRKLAHKIMNYLNLIN